MSEQEHGPWKSSNEFLPFHPSASHVEPGYRDGWNACWKASRAALASAPEIPSAQPAPTDAQILATLDGLLVTGENQNHGGVYRYRSLGTPSNVTGPDLVEFARRVLERFGHGKPAVQTTVTPSAPVGDGTQPAGEEAERHRRIGAAVERVCRELPDGCDITLYLGRGYGGATMSNTEGRVVPLDGDDERDLAREIEAGIDAARAAQAGE